MAVNHEKKAALINDLIASITAEGHTFDMSAWTTDEDEATGPATCETASCLAGHLEAIRPALAAQLAECFEAEEYDGTPTGRVDHAELAVAIWKRETGEASCPLDFLGHNTPRSLERLTVEDAVAHVRGENPEWPLLTGRSR